MFFQKFCHYVLLGINENQCSYGMLISLVNPMSEKVFILKLYRKMLSTNQIAGSSAVYVVSPELMNKELWLIDIQGKEKSRRPVIAGVTNLGHSSPNTEKILKDDGFSGVEKNPANIYLFKINNRNTKKGVKYVQS